MNVPRYSAFGLLAIPGATKVSMEAAGLNTKEGLERIGTFAGTGEVQVKPLADNTYVITCEGSKSVFCASDSVRVRVSRPDMMMDIKPTRARQP
jgi:hypothetical protein